MPGGAHDNAAHDQNTTVIRSSGFPSVLGTPSPKLPPRK
jgi:hypothetical protein